MLTIPVSLPVFCVCSTLNMDVLYIVYRTYVRTYFENTTQYTYTVGLVCTVCEYTYTGLVCTIHVMNAHTMYSAYYST